MTDRQLPNQTLSAEIESALSRLNPENQMQMREWIADGTFTQRAIDTMFEQGHEILRLEKQVTAHVVSCKTETEPVIIGMRDAGYKDSTPLLHVGNSAFEDWFQAQPFATQSGIKQISRDSYAAGMGDPLVTYATPSSVQEPVRIYDYVWPQRDEHKDECVYACSYTPGHHLARGELLAVVHPSQLKSAYLQRDDEDTPLNVATPPAARPAVPEGEAFADFVADVMRDIAALDYPVIPGKAGVFCVSADELAAILHLRSQSLAPTPPAAQRQWVGLTDEQINNAWLLNGGGLAANRFHDFARAIEAKLRSKNDIN